MTQQFTKEVKQKWLAALRSGEFKQGMTMLHNPTNNAYCCLGVLSKICGRLKSDEFDRYYDGEHDTYCASLDGILPDEVQYKLWRLNDNDGKTFPEIADYIEANVVAIDEQPNAAVDEGVAT